MIITRPGGNEGKEENAMEKLLTAIRRYVNGEYNTLLSVCVDFPKMDKAKIMVRDKNGKILRVYPNVIELYRLCPISYLVADVLEIIFTWYEGGRYEYQIVIQRGSNDETEIRQI